MNIKKKYLYALIAVIASGFLYFSYSPNVKEFADKQDAEEATKNVLSLYLEDGMLGLITLSKECYEHDDISKHHCFLIDIASSLWDKSVTNAMRLPTEEYFDDEAIIKRVLENDKQKKFTKDNVYAYMQEATIFVKHRLVIEWGLQKHKLEDDN